MQVKWLYPKGKRATIEYPSIPFNPNHNNTFPTFLSNARITNMTVVTLQDNGETNETNLTYLLKYITHTSRKMHFKSCDAATNHFVLAYQEPKSKRRHLNLRRSFQHPNKIVQRKLLQKFGSNNIREGRLAYENTRRIKRSITPISGSG